MDIGCVLWCLVCLLIIAMVACIAPWWFIPLIVSSTLLYMVFDGGSIFKSHKSHKAKKSKQYHKNNDKTKVNKSNVVGDTAAVLAGAALYHNIKKHHKHDETKVNENVEELDLWDAEHDDLYDMGIEDSMSDYDDDLAAYDDYIVSLDDDY